jgi:adenylosuccinate synthase
MDPYGDEGEIMTSAVVMGLQWGDEGKGRIVDYLCGLHHTIVVRCNGGPNAGHKIPGRDGILRDVHQLPSGAFSRTLGIMSRGMVLNPRGIANEINKWGLSRERFLIDARAHVIINCHRKADEFLESISGKSPIGTTKTGNGPAYAEKALRRGIRVQDVLDSPTDAAKRVMSPLCPPQLLRSIEEELTEMQEVLMNECPPVDENVPKNLLLAHETKSRIIFEVAHGFGLDIDHGDYPYVTSSTCGVGAVATAGFDPRRIGMVIGVIKPYSTRVGSGPIPPQFSEGFSEEIRKKGGEFGTTTGRARRIGALDLDRIRVACDMNGVEFLALTHYDVAQDLDDIPIVHEGRMSTIKCDKLIPRIEASSGRLVAVVTNGPRFEDVEVRFPFESEDWKL